MAEAWVVCARVGATAISSSATADHATRQKRLIEHVRTLYRKDDLTALLPIGEVEPLALPGENYTLALTPSLLAQVFKRRRAGQPAEDLLPNPAKWPSAVAILDDSIGAAIG